MKSAFEGEAAGEAAFGILDVAVKDAVESVIFVQTNLLSEEVVCETKEGVRGLEGGFVVVLPPVDAGREGADLGLKGIIATREQGGVGAVATGEGAVAVLDGYFEEEGAEGSEGAIAIRASDCGVVVDVEEVGIGTYFTQRGVITGIDDVKVASELFDKAVSVVAKDSAGGVSIGVGEGVIIVRIGKLGAVVGLFALTPADVADVEEVVAGDVLALSLIHI